ncbi:MAG: hypothetical protein GDA36_12125 [Rhodobacteraceae bacterium]|nr:hypothetical protein [Paracoccaceae bacterium]
MFGGSSDLAILSGPLALPGLTVWQGGFGGLVMRLPVFTGQVLPDCHQVPVGRPDYRAARHHGIGIAQSRKRRLQISLPPRCSQARRGR